LNPNADPNAKYFKKFLATIRRIPRGKVATYGDIAYAAGFPGMARQVAWALHASVPGVPWQRVVGSGGKVLLGGEHGFEQRMRLQQEGVAFIGQRVDMNAHHHSFFAKKSAKSNRGTKVVKKKKVSRTLARKSKGVGR
jgi:methylated-DNA-protein-cysteine methyltransferase related protein